jgi:Tol biopolymer transport system component
MLFATPKSRSVYALCKNRLFELIPNSADRPRELYPYPSPDGKQIAFSMKGEDGTRQIGLVSLDGGELRQLTHTADHNNKPLFSPDGRYLALLRGEGQIACLVIVNVETGEETIVANDASSIRPVWRSAQAP